MKRGILIILIVAAVFCVWLYAGRWTKVYRERNAEFEVSGIVLDALAKKPVTNLEVQVWCAEAVTSDHKLRGAPFSITNYIVKSDEYGAFSVKCFGGRISLGFVHAGYNEMFWRYDTGEGRLGIKTNIVVELVPRNKKAKAPEEK